MRVDPSTINSNSLLWGAAVLSSLDYYVVRGKEGYSGPIIEADDVSESDHRRIVLGIKRG